MNTYEIEIFYLTDYTQMHKICTALYDAGVGGEDIDECGLYLQDNKPNSVFIEPTDLGKAVEIINHLGYKTNEDTIEDDNS